MRNHPLLLPAFLVISISALRPVAASASPLLHDVAQPEDFRLVDNNQAADIYTDPADFKVVRIAVEALGEDIAAVTGQHAAIKNAAADLSANAVLAGTMGHSSAIDALVAAGKLDVSTLKNQPESFVIAVVRDPLPHVQRGLVIAGSDRRGTAFGVFEVSQQIGVSPWRFWADVPPRHRDSIFIGSAPIHQGSPSIKYRGIFINDEDWGMRPWAAKTFAPADGNIGPATYAKMFELLLRLKANYLWPAMHPGTRAFNSYPENRQLADDYAIVMGSSHCEPMLRNNVGEWDVKTRGEWDYQTNRDGIRKYWEERVADNHAFENVYTVGMRGIHDGPMPGKGPIPVRVKLLEQVFADERDILSRLVNKNPAQVPQLFLPYKEVLDLYRAGLNVPDDVTLGWVDDNHGYIRQLSTPTEQKRAGGSGVYYHVSYWGAPHDYLWLCSTPPALIWEEMSKAYDYDARNVWVLNVGDLKPAEIDIEYFLRLAWNVNEFKAGGQVPFLQDWAAREFGDEHAAAIAELMDQYYRLGYARKPEHMGFNAEKTPIARTEFSPISYGDEARQRLDGYAKIVAAADAVYNSLPADRKDAFYELVLYPVRCAGLMNQKFLDADRSFLYASQGRVSANDYAAEAKKAHEQIQVETEKYNSLANGKWRGMMSSAPHKQVVFDMPPTATFMPAAGAGFGVAVEGHWAAVDAEATEAGPKLAATWAKKKDSSPDLLPIFSGYTRRSHFVDLFNTGSGECDWSAEPSAAWIVLSAKSGHLGKDTRIDVSIDWAHAPVGENTAGSIVLASGGSKHVVQLRVENPKDADPEGVQAFVEDNGVIAMEAERFSRQTSRGGAEWRVIPGLGRTGDSIAVFPTTTASVNDPGRLAAESPGLEYDLLATHGGRGRLLVTALPTHPTTIERKLRYAAAVDEGTPMIVDLEKQSKWAVDVLRAASVGSSEIGDISAGRHVLHVWMVDPGVVLDKLTIDFGGLQTSYLGPPVLHP